MYIKLFEEYYYEETYIEEVLTKILDTRGINYSKIEYFNKGTMGVLYDLGNGKLFKITNHIEEAKTAAWLKENRVPFVVKIHDVFQVSSSNIRFPRGLKLNLTYWENCYFILMDKIDTSISDDIEKLYLHILEEHPLDPSKYTVLQVMRKAKVFNYIQHNYPDEIPLFRNIYYLLQTLKDKYDITYRDAHAYNFGLDENRNLKVFDLYDKRKRGEIDKMVL